MPDPDPVPTDSPLITLLQGLTLPTCVNGAVYELQFKCVGTTMVVSFELVEENAPRMRGGQRKTNPCGGCGGVKNEGVMWRTSLLEKVAAEAMWQPADVIKLAEVLFREPAPVSPSPLLAFPLGRFASKADPDTTAGGDRPPDAKGETVHGG